MSESHIAHIYPCWTLLPFQFLLMSLAYVQLSRCIEIYFYWYTSLCVVAHRWRSRRLPRSRPWWYQPSSLSRHSFRPWKVWSHSDQVPIDRGTEAGRGTSSVRALCFNISYISWHKKQFGLLRRVFRQLHPRYPRPHWKRRYSPSWFHCKLTIAPL